MDGLTPASADDLPQLGDLVADEPFWRFRWHSWTGKLVVICVVG